MTEQNTPKMTHDEMIDVLKGLVFGTFDRTTAKEREALDMAIKALDICDCLNPCAITPIEGMIDISNIGADQCKWWVNHLFSVAKEQACNSHNFDDAEEIQSAQDKIIKVLEQEPIEVEAAKLQEAYNKGFTDGQKALYEHLKLCKEESEEDK